MCTCVSQGVPVTLDKHTLGFDTGGECFFYARSTGSANWGGVSQWFPTFLIVTDCSVEQCGHMYPIKQNHQWETKINFFSDATLNEAAQILRLLHIEELRELQTKINEAIVAVQAIIADPKTDHRLGKVGRWEWGWRGTLEEEREGLNHRSFDFFFLCLNWT